MILKFNLFVTTALLGQTNGFTAFTSSSYVSFSRTSSSLSSLNSDWDNADFLSALSGNADDLNKVNEDYRTLSGANQAKNEWLVKSMQNNNNGDGGPHQQAAVPPPQTQQPPVSQFQQQVPPQQFAQQQQQPPVQQFYDQNGNPITTMPMVYDANGNLVPFNPPYQAAVPPPLPQTQPTPQQPQGGAAATPAAIPPLYTPVAEPPLPPKTKQPSTNDHKPVGYNSDAYTISNTADVYFAQLKQDSKVRKRAWLSGDVETANKVFTDDSVKQIAENWVENPYTKEQNVREARAQIEGAVRMQVLNGGSDDTVNQISYREKLEERMKQRGKSQGQGVSGGNSKDAPGNNKPNDVNPSTSQSNNVAPENNNPMPNPQVNHPKEMNAPSPPMTAAQTNTITTQSAPLANTPPQMSAPSASFTSASAAPIDSEEETRQKVRTLQGLLLKQRGGPGFGAGRLRAPEAQRLESTLKEVTDMLRSETSADAHATKSMTTLPSPTSPAVTSNPVPSTTVIQPSPQKLVAEQKVPSMSQPTSPPVDPIAGTVACVEAALKMYKEASSQSERDALLLPLREAFMAAAGASNKVIAEAELNAHRAGSNGVSTSPPPPPAAKQSSPSLGFPTSYNVAKVEQEDEEQAAGFTAVENADNTQKLEDVYKALKDYSGDGKFGLKNISGNEVRAS